MCPYPWRMNGFGRVEEGSPGAGEHGHTERRHVLDSAGRKTLPPDESDSAPPFTENYTRSFKTYTLCY